MEVEDDPDDPGLDETSEEELAESATGTVNDPPKGVKHRHANDVFIAEGFYTDCDNLLKQYLALKTSTFEDFVKLWNEKKFSSVFLGRDTHSEMFEFTEEALTIAKSFMLPPHSKVKRIGALYLMYGLYTQQPFCGVVKFRFTPPEWSILLKFVENLKAHGFIDANYIFYKMCIDGAFLTVAYSREYGLERNFRKYLMPWPARDKELDPSSTFSLETLMGRVYRGSLKAVADECLSKYNSIKQSLEAADETKFLGVAGTDKELEHIMQTDIEDVIGSADALKGTKKVANIGHERQSLKDKAFQQQPYQKGSCIAEMCSFQSSSPNTVQNKPEVVAGSESHSEDSEDSEDSEFQLMVKPPSRRHSRKIKLAKQKKVSKEKSKRLVSKSTRTAPYDEIDNAKVLKSTPKNNKSSTADPEFTMGEEASSSSHQSCTLIEADSASNTLKLRGACNDSIPAALKDRSCEAEKSVKKSTHQNARSMKRKSSATYVTTSRGSDEEVAADISNLSSEEPVQNPIVVRRSNRKSIPKIRFEETVDSTPSRKHGRKKRLKNLQDLKREPVSQE